MVKKSSKAMIGSWAFLIGVVLAVIFGIFSASMTSSGMLPGMMYFFIVLGIIIGLLNVADEEVTPFLMAGAVLVIVSNMGMGVVRQIPLFFNAMQALTALFVPATIIVALKHVFSMARN